MTRENYEEILKSSGKIVGMVLGEPSLDDSVGLITGQKPIQLLQPNFLRASKPTSTGLGWFSVISPM